MNLEPNKLTIGLFGFGVVGNGLYDVLQSTPALNASIKKICIRSAAKKRNIAADHKQFAAEFSHKVEFALGTIESPAAIRFRLKVASISSSSSRDAL